MKLSLFTVVSALAASVVALPASDYHVVHEKRSASASWSEDASRKPDGSTRLPVRIGLKENNLDQGHDILMRIADPVSEEYGRHLSPQQVS